MEVTRNYGARSGRLLGMCAGQSGQCGLVNESYVWDAAGNLNLRVKDTRYQEAFTYDALNRLTQATVTVHNGITSNITTVHNTYDRLGNLCTSLNGNLTHEGRSGCGLNTTHGSGGSGPVGAHLVSRVVSGTAITGYYYDIRGNQTVRDAPGTANDRTIHYSLDDLAHEIQHGGNSIRFWYAPDEQCYKQEAGGKRTLYLGNVEIETNAGISTIKRTLGGVLLQTSVGNSSTNHYLFHDALGSLVRATQANGTVIDVLDYHPFGACRTPSSPNGVASNDVTLTRRGFTGHEHVGTTNVDVIHMNGRLFDPALGRFLQIDPLVQATCNLQSWNPYTYVFNNPLIYTDPSGFFQLETIASPDCCCHFYYRSIHTQVAKLVSNWLSGIVAGSVSGFVEGVINGKTFKSGIQGAFSGAMFGAVKAHWENRWPWYRVGLESIAGGISAEISGQKFSDGFKTTLVMSSIKIFAVWTRKHELKQSSQLPGLIGESEGAHGIKGGLGGGRQNVRTWKRMFGVDLGEDRDYTKYLAEYRLQVSGSLLGGHQGGEGRIFGIKYAPNGAVDKIVESYAGIHDFLNNPMYRHDGAYYGFAERALGWFGRGIDHTINTLNVFVAT